MYDTLIIQSHRKPLPLDWLQRCLKSVEDWSKRHHYEYRFIGDELFDRLPDKLIEKTANQKVIATDLARLVVLREALEGGYQTVVWMDADFFIFAPDKFKLTSEQFALGRETWVQQDQSGRLKTYKKVHNAFLMFRQGNQFLDFYIDTATRLLEQNNGNMPPQFIGPKLLSALHNICQFPVMESAGMLSPLVLKDIIQGKGAASDMFKQNSPAAICGANLCSSLTQSESLSESEMQLIMDRLDKVF